MEPGWRGVLRIELFNERWWPLWIIAGSPIAQIEFNLLDEPTEIPYNGKYQDQKPEQEAIFEG
jgi:dCTP deaminase